MSRPAIVKFIGDPRDYRFGCGKNEWKYCRDCEERETCSRETPAQFTKGWCYHAYFLEYWQGTRNSLHLRGNDGKIDDYVPFEDFEVISDPDRVLNTDEAIVRCTTHCYDGDSLKISFGKEYAAIARDANGFYLVKDDSQDCDFYFWTSFEIVSDPKGLLSDTSCYYNYSGGENGLAPDPVAAHDFSHNHKPELEKDDLCGCFYCLKRFSPKLIRDWLISDNDADRRGTAICPYCGIDSVIGESSSYPITDEFLQEMHGCWFGDRAR